MTTLGVRQSGRLQGDGHLRAVVAIRELTVLLSDQKRLSRKLRGKIPDRVTFCVRGIAGLYSFDNHVRKWHFP